MLVSCALRRRTLVTSMAGSRFMVTCSGQHPTPCCSLLWWAPATTSPLCLCVSLLLPLSENSTPSEYHLIKKACCRSNISAALFFVNLVRKGIKKKGPVHKTPNVNCKPKSHMLFKDKLVLRRDNKSGPIYLCSPLTLLTSSCHKSLTSDSGCVSF